MYIAKLTTLLQEAMKGTFDDDYPIPEFRKVNVGLDYPINEQDYPGIWIDFTPTQPTRQAGVGHMEYQDTASGEHIRKVTRWLFFGQASFTVVAMSSLERYRLVDEVVRVLGFSEEESATAHFRRHIENNDLLAVNCRFDEIDQQGFSAEQGTPWGGTEFIYEGTLTIDLQGEYLSDPVSGSLVKLTEIVVYPYNDQEPDPFEGQEHGEDGWQ